jgi:hypothetical protein
MSRFLLLSALILAAVMIWHPPFVFGGDYVDAVLSDKPVVLYRFEESAGSLAANSAGMDDDETAKSTDGLYHDPQLSVDGALQEATAASNLAAGFNGSSSHVVVRPTPDVLDITGALTIEMWIRPKPGGKGTQCIVSKGDFVPNAGHNSWYLVSFQGAAGGRLRFGVGTGDTYIDQSGEIPADKYTHVVVTFDPRPPGNNATIYLDGKVNRTARIDVTPPTCTGQPLVIGALSYDPQKTPLVQYFKGDLDELAIYDHVLSGERVRSHFLQLNVPDVVPYFERDIQPILAAHCHRCHEGSDAEAGLDLTTLTSIMQGGKNGPAIVRGSASRSILTDMIQHGDMPPDEETKLSAQEVNLIERWIDEGAPADEQVALPSPRTRFRKAAEQHWAFRPLTFPNVPPATGIEIARARTVVDAFILEKLSALGLDLSPDTNRRRLIRRMYFDIVGLPPPFAEVERFVADPRPDAANRLLDRLLASPHFGVRWGRHWLDIVGYTDTISFDDDFGPPIGFIEGKWRYRDYVVRAWNENKPFDIFLREQLAGDEMVDWRSAESYTPEIIDHLVATGYLRSCEDISLEDPRPFIIWSVLHDTVTQIGTSFLGLTLNCARCHSHKFEPVSQQDYYSLMALFTPALNVPSWKNPKDRALPDVSSTTLAEINAHNAEQDKQIAAVNATIAELKKPYASKLRDEKIATLPEPIRQDVKAALDAPAEQRNDVQRYLTEKLEALVTVTPEEIEAAFSPDDKQTIAGHNAEIGRLNAGKRSHGWIMAVYDDGTPPTTHLFKRGDYLLPRREVAPEFLNILSSEATDQILARATSSAESEQSPVRLPENSGRRTALAHWLTDRDSPASGLAARVMVNRIWQHLFGQGIVTTVENMGVSGASPTHPELLDWIAADFRDHGWDLKHTIRQIMSSTVYRQASSRLQSAEFGAGSVGASTPHSEFLTPNSVDPDNGLLWRARLRRLEAEAVRDAILAVNGRLDSSPGGPPVPLEYHPDGQIVVATQGLPTPTSQWRRTLYLLNRRIYNPSFLSIFDKPIVTAAVCQRDDSAVALQSLAMMNDAFVLEQAAQLADRVTEQSIVSGQDPVVCAYQLVLSRQPVPLEHQWSQEFLDQQKKLLSGAETPDDEVDVKALTELCQTLLNANEFLYLE